MKSFSLAGISFALILLLFSGCAKTPETAKQKAAAPSQKDSQSSTFSSVSFNLPKEIAWIQSQNQPIGGGGVVEWIPKGYTSQNSPVRVIYQKKQPGVSPEARLQEILAPIKDCADSRITRFNGKSSYKYQANAEVFCSKMGKNNWGTISYVTVFSNRDESDVLIGEILTRPTKKAGAFPNKTEQEKKTLDEIKKIGKLLFEMTLSMRACQEDGNCR